MSCHGFGWNRAASEGSCCSSLSPGRSGPGAQSGLMRKLWYGVVALLLVLGAFMTFR